MIKYVKYKLNEYIGYHLNEWNDEYLSMLAECFDEGDFVIESIKRQILNPTSKGITTNKIDIDFINNKSIIKPQFGENPDQYAIEIDRTILLNLLNKWQEMEAKKLPEIYLIMHENGKIDLVDTLPEE